jgi:hypothetical protein
MPGLSIVALAAEALAYAHKERHRDIAGQHHASSTPTR